MSATWITAAIWVQTGAPDFHELAFWKDNAAQRFECAETYVDLLEKADRPAGASA